MRSWRGNREFHTMRYFVVKIIILKITIIDKRALPFPCCNLRCFQEKNGHQHSDLIFKDFFCKFFFLKKRKIKRLSNEVNWLIILNFNLNTRWSQTHRKAEKYRSFCMYLSLFLSKKVQVDKTLCLFYLVRFFVLLHVHVCSVTAFYTPINLTHNN